MSGGLHIAYVCADRGVPVGGAKGASVHVAAMSRALAARGAQVHVIASRRAPAADGCVGQVAVTDLGSQRANRKMRQLLLAGANGKHGQARAAEAYGLLLNQGLAKHLEKIHRRWRIDAVYERYSLWSFAAAGFACAARVPYILEVNAPLREEQRRYRELENPAAAAAIESYLFRLADGVIVPAAELQPYVVRHGARASSVRVIPNAADPTRYQGRCPVRGTARRRSGPFVVGFLGSLKPWHGVGDLVRAFRRLRRLSPDYRLLIAGDGPLRPLLEKSLRWAGELGAVTFTGEVPYESVPEIVARMDVGVAPYPRLRGFYFSPLKIFEYMAAGVPIVASDIGQIGAVLAHRETALLHRPGCVGELVAAVERLRRSPALAERLAREARRLVGRRYTWRRNADRVLALIATAKRRKARIR